MIEQRHLRQVLAIIEHGSFRKAADALHMSQPALSKSILTLENALGVRLIDRQTRPVRPTVFGRLFLERARLATGIVEDLDRQIRQLSQLRKGQVRIGLARPGEQSLVGHAVALFTSRYPDIRLSLEVGSTEVMMARFESLRLELVLSDEEIDRYSDWYQTLSLGEDRLECVARAGHPLLEQGGPHSLHAVLQYPLTVPAVPRWGQDWIETTLREENAEPVERKLPWIACDSYDAINDILESTDHVSFGLVESFQRNLDLGRLGIVTLRAPAPAWRPLVAFHSRHTLSPATEAFLTCLLETRGVIVPDQFAAASPV